MIEINPPILPIISFGNETDVKKEEKEEKKMLEDYFMDGNREVRL